MKANSKDNILILGFGREGQSLLKYFRVHNPTVPLAIADQTERSKLSKSQLQLLPKFNINDSYFGPAYLEQIDKYSLIFKSPGIPINPSLAHWQKQPGNKLTSATQLFLETCSNPVIGITGTKGKSTTSALIHHVLSKNGIETVLVGNIGTPAISILDSIRNEATVVMELSSHQLADIRISPTIAVVHNIYPEHLDYYKSMEEYVEAKTNITRFQRISDLCIYNTDNDYAKDIGLHSIAKKVSFSIDGKTEADYIYRNSWIIHQKSQRKIFNTENSPLIGKFNILNLFPAIIIAEKYQLSESQISTAIQSFKPLPHRLQKIGPFKSITFIDDTLATLPEATIAAVQALDGRVETIILGGAERQQDFSELFDFLSHSSVQNILLFPPTGERMRLQINQTMPNRFDLFSVSTMKEAVATALRCTKPNSMVLLSPAAPSFGIFKDYQDKSEQFKYWVEKLAN